MRRNANYRAPHHRHTVRVWTCKGKVRYRDRDEALDALRLLSSPQALFRTRKPITRAYECPACHGYHLTSQTSRAQ